MGAHVSKHAFFFRPKYAKSNRRTNETICGLISADWLEALAKETEETDTTTELIISEARNVAMDVLKASRDAAVTNASEAEVLQDIFDTP
jgi:hypothetical protein